MLYNSYELLWFFLLYAFLGWLSETALAAVRKNRLINRGFLNAPFSPTYGLGGVLFTLFLADLHEDLFFLFLGGAIIATFLELVTGGLLEKLFHQKWWDYSQYKWNFGGYICARYSVIWGLLALLVLLVLNPLASFVLSLIPYPLGRVALIVVYVLLGIDFFGSWLAVLQLHSSLKGPNEVYKFWHKLSQRLDNAVTRRIQKRMALAYPSLEKDKLRSIAQEREKLPPFAYGIGYYKLFSLFLIGAFLGDITETVWCLLTAGRLMSRSSVVYGPFSIVWGLGCVLLTALLYRYRERSDSFIFLFGTVVGGAYEYICSVFTELMFGTIFWDYSHLPFNLAGRINLLFCFFWGIAAVLWIKHIYPQLSKRIEKIPLRTGKWLVRGLSVFMLFNILISGLALARYHQRTGKREAPSSALELFLDQRFPDERIERIYPNMKLT